jgi:hypothetical protein
MPHCDCHCDRDGYGYSDPYTDGDTNGHGDSDPHSDGNTHGYGDAYGNINTKT